MIKLLLILSLIFFQIAIGCVVLYRKEFKKSGEVIPIVGDRISMLIFVLSILFSIILLQRVSDIKWYWCVLCVFFIGSTVSDNFSLLYVNFFGYKSKPRLSLRHGDFVRHSLYIMDVFISFGIGILFLMVVFFILLFNN